MLPDVIFCEAVDVIEDVINNGRVIKKRWDKVTFENDCKRVVVSKNLRNGKGRLSKKRVVTSFDNNIPKNKKGAPARVTPGKPDEGAGAVAPNLSGGKGSDLASEKQRGSKKVGRRMQRTVRWKDEVCCKMLGTENREVNGRRLKGGSVD